MSTTEIHNGISYSTPIDQRRYQEPPVQPEWRAPKVAAPALKAEGSVVERTHKAILHARDEQRRHIAETDVLRAHFTEDGYRARLAEFANTAAAKAVDTEFAAVTAHRDAALANVDKVRRDLSKNGDTAAELRASRYRDRVIRTLDAKDSGELYSTANELISAASREELGTLLQELSPYLRARGATVDWIDEAVAQVVPEFATARAQLKRAEAAFQITRQNMGFVKQGFANGRPATIFADPSEYA